MVLLDGPPNPAAMTRKPALTVTLDLPYPLSDADRKLWGNPVAGTMPLTLTGQTRIADPPGVTWTTVDASRALLGNLFGVLGKVTAADQILCHLALDGRATGGTDWTQWCWVVASKTNLMLVPSRKGRLHLLSAREMVARAIPRADLRAMLRAGTHVSDGPGQDMGLARRAAGNAFRRAERRLVLVVAEPYAAAARVIADALTAAVKVTVEIVPAADPAAAASTRIAAGETVDVILTDDASLPPITALPDFPEAYPL